MRKYDTTSITATSQAPLKTGTLNHLQLAYQEVFNAILTGIQSPIASGATVILYGCAKSVVGLNTTISAGAIWDPTTKEVYLCTSSTFVNPTVGQVVIGKINTAYYNSSTGAGITADPTKFIDSSTHNIHQIRTVYWLAGTTGSGDISDYDECQSFSPGVTWETLYPTILNVPTLVSQNAFTAWSNLPLATGWTSAILASYRKDGSGRVYLRGTIRGSGSVSGGAIATLPSGFRPSVTQYFPCLLEDTNTSTFYTASVAIGSITGEMILADITIPIASGWRLSLDPIIFLNF